jgi:hypothetical protein
MNSNIVRRSYRLIARLDGTLNYEIVPQRRFEVDREIHIEVVRRYKNFIILYM